MSLALLFRYLMLNMFRMLIPPSSGACDLFVELFHGLYCSGSMCVGVTLWFRWGDMVWYPDAKSEIKTQIHNFFKSLTSWTEVLLKKLTKFSQSIIPSFSELYLSLSCLKQLSSGHLQDTNPSNIIEISSLSILFNIIFRCTP